MRLLAALATLTLCVASTVDVGGQGDTQPTSTAPLDAVGALLEAGRVSHVVQLCFVGGEEDAPMLYLARDHPDAPASVNVASLELGNALADAVGKAPVSVLHGTARAHMTWVSDNVDVAPPDGRLPLFWLPGGGCEMALYEQLSAVAEAAPRAFVVLPEFLAGQVTNQGRPPRRRSVKNVTYNFRSPGNPASWYQHVAAQESSWAYMYPAVGLGTAAAVHHPKVSHTDWALLTYNKLGVEAPPLPANLASRLQVSPLDEPLDTRTCDHGLEAPPPPQGLLFYAPQSDDQPLSLPHPDSHMAPFTNAAQDDIWRRQHPADCAAASFLVIRMYYAGIGSHVHKIASAMAVAHELGRVLLLDARAGVEYTDAAFCGATTNLHCFTLPLSNCSLPATSLGMFNCSADQSGDQVLLYSTFDNDTVPDVPFDRLPPATCKGGLHRKWVPTWWAATLAGAGYTATAPHYWWRTQAATYTMRLNPHTAAYLRKLRQRVLPDGVPPGATHMHVRHGDKFIEMELEPFQAYIASAEALVANHSLPRVGFLSTEDPLVVEDAHFLHQNWALLYLPVRRDNLPPFERASVLGKSTEMTLALLQLGLALECDAWVCTMESNWCRLVDEYRATWAGKYHLRHRYVEVGPTAPMENLTLQSWYW